MDIYAPGLRDRRVAAADVGRTRDGREIYGNGTSARRLSTRRGGRGFDVRTARISRSASQINTVILHQTTFFTNDPLPVENLDNDIADDHRLDFVIAHFLVRADGNILYLRDVEHILNSVSGRFGIDIEFEGQYGHEPTPRPPRLSANATQAGRRLIVSMHDQLPGLRFIHPHGQVQSRGRGKRDSCPGPDVWMNVGEWAVQEFGLTSDTTFSSYSNHGISPAQRNSAYDRHITTWIEWDVDAWEPW